MVEPLCDGVGLLGPLDELFPDMSEEDWVPYRERYPELVSGNEWRLPIMCFLVREGEETVLVDTGAGPRGLWDDWMPEPESQEGLLRELAGHGVERDEIDIVLLESRPHRPRRLERAGRRQRHLSAGALSPP